MIKRKVPDGGWGWVIVLGSFAIHLITDGLIYTAAIFYQEWIHYFKSSVFVTTMVISLMAGACLFIGPIAAAFIAVFGCRTVAFHGAIISCIGLTLTAYSWGIYFLLFTFGLMTGTGFGFLFISSIVVVTEYFEEKLALAAGLSSCGSSVGIIVFAPLIEHLNAHFKWRITIIIIAAINLLNLTFAMTFIPIETSVKSVEDISSGLAKLSSPESDERSKQGEEMAIRQPEETKVSILMNSLKAMFGTKLLLNTRFAICLLAIFSIGLGFLPPQIFIKVRAMSLDGVKSEKDTRGLLTFIGIGSTIGRIFFGYISDFKWCRRFVVLIVSTVTCGVVTVASIYCQTYNTLALYCFAFGVTSGAFIGISPVVINDIFGKEMVANAFGLMSLFEGIASVIGTPLIGLFESKSHKREFVISGVLIIIGGLTFTLIPTYDIIQGRYSQVTQEKKIENRNQKIITLNNK